LKRGVRLHRIRLGHEDTTPPRHGREQRIATETNSTNGEHELPAQMPRLTNSVRLGGV